MQFLAVFTTCLATVMCLLMGKAVLIVDIVTLSIWKLEVIRIWRRNDLIFRMDRLLRSALLTFAA